MAMNSPLAMLNQSPLLDPREQALLSIGASLLQAGAPRIGQPVSMGAALGGAVNQGMGAYQQAQDALFKRGMMQSQLESAGLQRQLTEAKIADRQRKKRVQELIGAGKYNEAMQMDLEETTSLLKGRQEFLNFMNYGGRDPNKRFMEVDGRVVDTWALEDATNAGGTPNGAAMPGAQAGIVFDAGPEWKTVMENGLPVQVSRKGEKRADPTAPDPSKDWRVNERGETVRTPKGMYEAAREYRAEVKPLLGAADEIRTKMGKVRSSLSLGTGSGDIAAINSFVRMVDDGVVRSEDIRLQQSAVSISEQLKIWVKQAKDGELLSRELRNKMESAASALYDETMKTIQGRLDGYKTMAEQDGVPFDRIVPRSVFDTVMADVGKGGKKPGDVSGGWSVEEVQ